jgi:hypothetical protein
MYFQIKNILKNNHYRTLKYKHIKYLIIVNMLYKYNMCLIRYGWNFIRTINI